MLYELSPALEPLIWIRVLQHDLGFALRVRDQHVIETLIRRNCPAPARGLELDLTRGPLGTLDDREHLPEAWVAAVKVGLNRTPNRAPACGHRQRRADGLPSRR